MKIDRPGAIIYQFRMAATRTSRASPTEEIDATPIASARSDEGKVLDRGFLRAARKDLTEDEASSAAGMRWLQYEAERLDKDCELARTEIKELRVRLDSMTAQYTDARIEIETLKGAGRLSRRNEFLSTLCVGAGSAGLGAAPSFLSLQGASSIATVGMGISGVLLVGGLILRVWK